MTLTHIDLLTSRPCRVVNFKPGNYVAVIEYEDMTRAVRTIRQIQEVTN